MLLKNAIFFLQNAQMIIFLRGWDVFLYSKTSAAWETINTHLSVTWHDICHVTELSIKKNREQLY